jgi:hypothetical protein
MINMAANDQNQFCEIMTFTATDRPALSLVLPTMGKGQNLFRCLDSIVHNAPASLLSSAEIVVFINADPIAEVNYARVDAYLDEIRHRFASMKVVRSERFELTAEESAFAASAHATGKFLWIVGDARIFLPEGLVRLDAWLKDPTAPAAFFNTVWYNSDGFTNGQPSIHIAAGSHIMTYKQFVMHTGINFMATAMGAWVYERQYLDREKWTHIIKNCGPHFSHVATLLAAMGETPVYCCSTFLYINESKAYHSGDASEWVRYSKLAGTYRFYAWSLGLVRQFDYLIQQSAYTYADVRRSMCSEGRLLRRQVDEIYMHLLAQLRYGWANANEKIKQSEFDEIINFLSRSCPEKAVVNGLLKDLYNNSTSLTDKQFMAKFMVINEANQIDNFDLRLPSLIVDQVGDQYIRLHPKGYIASPVNDNSDFMLGYKLLDALSDGSRWSSTLNGNSGITRWRIMTESEFLAFVSKRSVKRIGDLFPVGTDRGRSQSRSKRFTSRMVTRFYRSRITYRLVAMLPDHVKKKLKSMLM